MHAFPRSKAGLLRYERGTNRRIACPTTQEDLLATLMKVWCVEQFTAMKKRDYLSHVTTFVNIESSMSRFCRCMMSGTSKSTDALKLTDQEVTMR
jgi:hypothetical protein